MLMCVGKNLLSCDNGSELNIEEKTLLVLPIKDCTRGIMGKILRSQVSPYVCRDTES